MNTSRERVLRMLAMVPYLQGNAGVDVRELADQLGVPEKQIHKDLQLLMYTGTGQGGGELIDVDLTSLEEDGVIHLRDAEFMKRPLRITAHEGAALVVALRTLRASAGADEAAVIDSALAKIEAALGDAASTPVDVVVDAVDPVLHGTISHALTAGRRLSLVYSSPSRDDQTERLVDPQRLFTELGRLYLEAWCLRAGDIRFFRLDRVVSAELTDDPVEDHDVEPSDLSAGVFAVQHDTPYALVRLHPYAQWMTDYHPMELVEQDADGIWTAKLFGADTEWLRRLVVRSAGSVEVLEPQELRALAIETARSALAAYDEDVTP